jgi:uncharacterized protein
MITLIPLNDTYYVCQFAENQEIPIEIRSADFFSFTRTKEEISIVTNCKTDFEFLKTIQKWKGFKVDGILSFSLVGIINDITQPLKREGIPVFVLSTFNTDYIFVMNQDFEKAIGVFRVTENLGIKETDKCSQ